MTIETETKAEMTDAELLDRIRSIQVEMGSLTARLDELADEINVRRNLFRDGRERWSDLNEELHNLVAVPYQVAFTP